MAMVLTVPDEVIGLIESFASSHGMSPAQVMITAVRQLADHDQHTGDTDVVVDVVPVAAVRSIVPAVPDMAFRDLVAEVIVEHRDILDDLAR
jgi:hypothetical protein